MGSFSIWHWMLFGAVALLLFGGKGKISDLMGDVAKGVKSFKKGLADDDERPPPLSPRRGRSRIALASRRTTSKSAEPRAIQRERPPAAMAARRCSTFLGRAGPVSHVRF